MTFPGDKYPIAIDSDGKELFALQLRKQNSQLAIQAIFFHPLTTDNPRDSEHSWDSYLPVLKKLKKTRGFKGSRVVIHPPLEKVLCFPVDVYLEKGQDPDEAILMEAAKSLPYPIEDAVIDYPSIFHTESQNRQTAIITAARRSDLLELTITLKEAGFITDAIDFGPISLIRLHECLFPPSEDPYIICHIGRGQSSLQVVNQNRIFALSKFTWGRDLLVNKLNQTLGLSDSGFDAAYLLKTHGVQGEATVSKDNKVSRTISRIIMPSLEELVYEFQKVLGYARAKEHFHKIDHIYFYGLGTTVNGLKRYVEKRLNIPAVQGEIGNKLNASEAFFPLGADHSALFYPVLGLAMRKVPWL